jgi:small GTP-binding protein
LHKFNSGVSAAQQMAARGSGGGGGGGGGGSGGGVTFKVLMLGDSGAGKSALLTRWVDGPAASLALASTMGVDVRARTVASSSTGATIRLQVWDTAGQERFRSLASNFYRGAHGVLMVRQGTMRR